MLEKQLRCEHVKTRDRQIPSRLQRTLEGSDRSVQASVPQSPPHRSDVLVDGRERAEDSAWDRGDLLHGLNLHSNVKPVDDVGRRLRFRTWQSLENFSTIRNYRDVAEATMPFSLKGVNGAISDCVLVGIAGGELSAARVSSATAASHDALEVAC